MITVYGREQCVQCEYTRKWLERLGHKFAYLDVDQDTEAQKAVAAMGTLTTCLPKHARSLKLIWHNKAS